MPWWIWVIGGVISLGAEIFIPIEFYLFFLGVAGICTGTLVYFQFLQEPWMQWTTCGVLALVLLLSVRRRLLDYLHANSVERSPEFEGDLVKIIEDIPQGSTGKGEARGTTWGVINESDNTLESGKSYRVARVEGLSLLIEEN